MITNKRVFELMKEAGLNEVKFAELLAKEDPKLTELTEENLDQVAGGDAALSALGGLGGLGKPID